MPDIRQQADTELPAIAGALERSAEARAAQVRELAELRRALVEAETENLKLHRTTLAALRDMQHELERVKRTLHSLATAR